MNGLMARLDAEMDTRIKQITTDLTVQYHARELEKVETEVKGLKATQADHGNKLNDLALALINSTTILDKKIGNVELKVEDALYQIEDLRRKMSGRPNQATQAGWEKRKTHLTAARSCYQDLKEAAGNTKKIATKQTLDKMFSELGQAQISINALDPKSGKSPADMATDLKNLAYEAYLFEVQTAYEALMAAAAKATNEKTTLSDDEKQTLNNVAILRQEAKEVLIDNHFAQNYAGIYASFSRFILATHKSATEVAYDVLKQAAYLDELMNVSGVTWMDLSTRYSDVSNVDLVTNLSAALAPIQLKLSLENFVEQKRNERLALKTKVDFSMLADEDFKYTLKSTFKNGLPAVVAAQRILDFNDNADHLHCVYAERFDLPWRYESALKDIVKLEQRTPEQKEADERDSWTRYEDNPYRKLEELDRNLRHSDNRRSKEETDPFTLIKAMAHATPNPYGQKKLALE